MKMSINWLNQNANLDALYKEAVETVPGIAKEILKQEINKSKVTETEKDIEEIAEFSLKHVLPAASSVCSDDTLPLVKEFMLESCEKFAKNEKVRGYDLAKPMASKVMDLMIKQVPKDATKNTVSKKAAKKVVKKTAKHAVSMQVAKKAAKHAVSKEVAEESISKVSQISFKEAAKEAAKEAGKAGLIATVVSALVGGVFLYRDLKYLDKEKEKLSEKDYNKKKAERVGDFVGDVVGSGVAAASSVGIAAYTGVALTGPVGWAVVGIGALFSFGTGKLGGKIAKDYLA